MDKLASQLLKHSAKDRMRCSSFVLRELSPQNTQNLKRIAYGKKRVSIYFFTELKA